MKLLLGGAFLLCLFLPAGKWSQQLCQCINWLVFRCVLWVWDHLLLLLVQNHSALSLNFIVITMDSSHSVESFLQSFMQSFTDHSRQLRLHLFKVCTVLKFTGIIYSSVRKSLRNVCDVLVEMMAILLEYQAGVYGFRTIKFDMRVSESTVLILN